MSKRRVMGGNGPFMAVLEDFNLPETSLNTVVHAYHARSGLYVSPALMDVLRTLEVRAETAEAACEEWLAGVIALTEKCDQLILPSPAPSNGTASERESAPPAA